MKYITLSLLAILLVFTSCEDKEKTDLMSQYETLLEERESLMIQHGGFEDMHKSLLATHNKLSTQLEGMTINDSTVFEKLARHEAIFAKHEANMEAHSSLKESHKDMKASFMDGTMDKDAMKAQIKEMKEQHTTMMNHHENMKQEHESIKESHDEIMAKINTFGTKNNES